jgi:type IV secretion system protein VirD4
MTGVLVTGSAGNLLKKNGHAITVGYARAGKGTTIILPALLHDSLKNHDAPSFIILDPKGENLAVAGRHLKNSGYNVICLNPFDLPYIDIFGNARFNPFDLIDINKADFNKYVDLIRYCIIPPDQNKHANSYFSEAAGDLISLYISYMMVQEDEPQTIKTLYRWLRYGGADRAALIDAMSKCDRFDIDHDAKAIAQQLMEGGKAIIDVYGNAISATNVFKDEQIRQSMSRSDFAIPSITRDKTAIFICLAPDDLQRMSAWVRIILACLMRGIPRYHNPDRKIVMIMDEFATIGHQKEFQEGMGFLAQYMMLWPIVQDLNQLKNHYPAIWETFVGNAAIRHWMVRDNFTAEYLSKRMPNEILFLGSNADSSPKYKEKPLMTAVEIMNFPNVIIEIDGIGKPAILRLKPYWDINRNYSRNPYY